MQTALIMAMYDDVSPNLKYLSFVEEILPFTDIVPSATIGWLMQFGPGMLGMQSEDLDLDSATQLIKTVVSESMVNGSSRPKSR